MRRQMLWPKMRRKFVSVKREAVLGEDVGVRRGAVAGMNQFEMKYICEFLNPCRNIHRLGGYCIYSTANKNNN